MSNIRLIGIDLDGTLLTKDHQVSPRNLAAINAARELGITIAIVTGRPHISAEQFALQLGLVDVPVISFNGAMIKHPGEKEPMFSAPVPADCAREIVQYAVDRRIHLHYYMGDMMYVTHMSHWARLYLQRTGIIPQPVGDLRHFDGQSPLKLLAVMSPEELPAVLQDGQMRYGDRLIVTRSMPEYVEYLSLEAGKGKAMRWLASHLEIPMEQTMGMGDMLNDLELIQETGIGVAMADAQDEVKACAQYVAQCQDGVAEAIENLVLK